MSPSQFTAPVYLYLIKCSPTVTRLVLGVDGGGLFLSSGQPLAAGALAVELLTPLAAKQEVVLSCPDDATVPDERCQRYTFEVFRALPSRRGGRKPMLHRLTLELLDGPPRPTRLRLRPGFQRDRREFGARMPIGTPFRVSAVGCLVGRCGSRAPASGGALVVVALQDGGGDLGCHQAFTATAAEHGFGRITSEAEWDSKDGFKKPGKYRFAICTAAPGGKGMVRYRLSITAVPTSQLRSLSVGGLHLVPDFRPEVHAYAAEACPGIVGTEDLQVVAKAKDEIAMTRIFAQGLQTSGTGWSSANLRFGAPAGQLRPTRVVVVVSSADGRSSAAYVVNVTRHCDQAGLIGIDVGIPGGRGCAVRPPFQHQVTDYRCVLAPSVSGMVTVVPHLDQANCPNCTVQFPLRRPGGSNFQPAPAGAGEPCWTRELASHEEVTLQIAVVAPRGFMRIYSVRFVREQTVRVLSPKLPPGGALKAAGADQPAGPPAPAAEPEGRAAHLPLPLYGALAVSLSLVLLLVAKLPCEGPAKPSYSAIEPSAEAEDGLTDGQLARTCRLLHSADAEADADAPAGTLETPGPQPARQAERQAKSRGPDGPTLGALGLGGQPLWYVVCLAVACLLTAGLMGSAVASSCPKGSASQLSPSARLLVVLGIGGFALLLTAAFAAACHALAQLPMPGSPKASTARLPLGAVSALPSLPMVELLREGLPQAIAQRPSQWPWASPRRAQPSPLDLAELPLQRPLPTPLPRSQRHPVGSPSEP